MPINVIFAGGPGGFSNGDDNNNKKFLLIIAGLVTITGLIIAYLGTTPPTQPTPPIGVDYLERELEEKLLKDFIEFFNKKNVSPSEFGDFLGTLGRFIDRASDREKRLLFREILEATGVKFTNLDELRDYVYELLHIT